MAIYRIPKTRRFSDKVYYFCSKYPGTGKGRFDARTEAGFIRMRKDYARVIPMAGLWIVYSRKNKK